MTNHSPAVVISADDYSRLASLAKATLARYPADDAQLLLDELHRADILPPHSIPERVIAMNSFVEFRDETTGNTRVLQLVFPHQADIRSGRLSVLSQIGAALIGLAEGQSINWETRDGREREVTVLRVSRKPFDERERAEQEVPACA
jgi:regulator of nucleoside diphosphate kinase